MTAAAKKRESPHNTSMHTTVLYKRGEISSPTQTTFSRDTCMHRAIKNLAVQWAGNSGVVNGR